MHELDTQNYFEVSNSDCDKRYSPGSTFKIPHSLIGLETGAMKDPNQLVPWDGHQYWTKYWNQDHTLYSAMKYSVVPYFVQLATKVGTANMRRYLKEFKYGNQYFADQGFLLNGQIFWLNNELKISANEQIAFLKKIYKNELDVQDKNLKAEASRNRRSYRDAGYKRPGINFVGTRFLNRSLFKKILAL